MQSVEPVLENAIKTLQKVVDVRGMGKKWTLKTGWKVSFWNLKSLQLERHTEDNSPMNQLHLPQYHKRLFKILEIISRLKFIKNYKQEPFIPFTYS